MLYKRGTILLQLQCFKEALASFDRALTIKPDYFEAQYSRGNALRHQSRFEEALASYDQALVIKPEFAQALNDRGNALQELKRFADAIASYDEVLRIKPTFAEALYNRGNALLRLERFEEALASYDKALAARPDYVDALNNRGNVLRELNCFEEALASYRKAATIKPDYAEALKNLGIVLKELGRVEEARWAAERAIQLAPRNASCYRLLGELLHYDSAADSGIVAMQQLARDAASLSVGDQIELHFALAKAYEDIGRFQDAFDQLLEGNALKRSQIDYNEAATLGTLKHLQEVFTSELIESRQDVGESSPIPVFIVGMPRSGTTLVEQILASHPQVFGAGELKYFSDIVGERAKQSGVEEIAELISGMPGEQYRQVGASYLERIRTLAPQAARITDKMPSNYVYLGFIHLALPKAPIIHTVRDPVDTCISCFSKLFTEEQNYSYGLAELGRYYRGYQALMAHWHRVLPPGRILDVHYEDVVTDLERAARRIIAYCGLEWDRRCLTFHKTERPVRTASAMQVRRPVYMSSVGRRHQYEAFLAPLLAELYP